MKELVRRREKGYSAKRIGSLKNLDIIASTLLALSYSRRYPQSCQQFIQYDCVAACMNGNDLWVASNSKQITGEDLDNLIYIMEKDHFIFIGDIYIVENGKGHMHAEMQLISELHSIRVLKPTASYIGVSKPCCLYCKEVLDYSGIGYANWHNDPPGTWESPYY